MTLNTKEQINIAINFQQNGKFEEAENLYFELLEIEPANPNVLNLLGLLKYQTNQYSDAEFFIKKAIELNPCAYFYENLGLVYSENEQFNEAIMSYKKALEKEPNNFGVWFNLALTLKKNQRVDESISAYRKALSINTDSYDTYFNLGNIYFQIKNDATKAAIYYEKAVALKPDDEETKYCLAMAYVKEKNFKDGWKYSEYRPSKALALLTHSMSQPELKIKPEWQGEPIKDKILYIYYEAAFGDTMMFARYLPLLKDKCAKVYFKPQVSHIQLMKDSDLGIEILDKPTSTDNLEFDVHAPLMGLPYLLQLNSEEDIPFAKGYLKANPTKVKSYKEKYFNNNKFKVGIKWQGNTNYALSRVIKLKSFYKLFNIPNVKFYSVQKGGGAEELEDAKMYDITDLAPTFNDFSDTAAAIENLDLVICNDTSVAHLTGALGKRCWTLLPFVQDWRWLCDTSYCPWYESVKIFQQKEFDNWDEVFDRVKDELQTLAGSQKVNKFSKFL